MYYIFVFKSRTNSIHFYEMLRAENIAAAVISTPPSAHVGCGLSVRVMPACLEEAKRIFSYQHFGTFLGLFLVQQVNHRTTISRMNF